MAIKRFIFNIPFCLPMKPRFFFLFLLTTACWLSVTTLPARPHRQPVPDARLRRLDSVLAYLNQRGLFNGVVLLSSNGKVRYQKALGIASLVSRSPLTIHSPFNLASLSTQFMAVLIMQLKEQRKLRYDQPVQDLLPAFPYPRITIRHLLTHTSGLPDYTDLAEKVNGPLDTLTNESLLSLLHMHSPALQFSPGAKWQYCTTGYVILGSVITALTGQPVEAVFRQQIAVPLGLTNSFVFHYQSLYPDNRFERVTGFRRNNGVLTANDLTRRDGVYGDGNVYASAADLLLWTQAVTAGKLVSAATMQEVFPPARLANGSAYPYGFGREPGNGETGMSQTGTKEGFYSEITRFFNEKQTLIVLTNGTNDLAGQIIRETIAGKPVRLPQTQLLTNLRLIDGTGTPAAQPRSGYSMSRCGRSVH